MEPAVGSPTDAPAFRDKFVAFLDILGFERMVEDANAGTGRTLDDLLRLIGKLGSSEIRVQLARSGPRTCPQSRAIRRDLDFRVTQVSDSVVVSAEVSPSGVINLVHHCWASVMELLHEGVLCRGYITRGQIYHSDAAFIGPAYQRAVRGEKKVTAFARSSSEVGTPFVEIDQSVIDFVESCGDACVRTRFWRNAEVSGGMCALYPFDVLVAPVVLAGIGARSVDHQRAGVNRNRAYIERLKGLVLTHAVRDDPKAWSKTDHYLRALDDQRAACDKTDGFIDALRVQLPRRTIGDLMRGGVAEEER